MMFIVLAFLMMTAEVIDVVHEHHQNQHHPAQSWDQENLKKNDAGCPTAIYVAPNGELEQCE